VSGKAVNWDQNWGENLELSVNDQNKELANFSFGIQPRAYARGLLLLLDKNNNIIYIKILVFIYPPNGI
jgi:hypothetical protein